MTVRHIRKDRVLDRIAAMLLPVVLFAVAACGSALPHEKILADTRAAAGGAQAPGASSIGQTLDTNSAGTRAGTGTASDSAGGSTSRGSASSVTNSGQGPTGSLAAGSAGGTTGGGQASASSTGSTACPANKSPLVIGSVGEQTGVFGALFRGGTVAVQAWAAYMNAKGGLNCHLVKYIVADDGGDPARHQALVQQLVEQDGVIAMVYMDAPLDGQASVSYITSKRIPVIGTEAGSPWVYTSPMYFPQGSSGDLDSQAAFSAVADSAVPQGKTKLAVLACVEAPNCSRFYQFGPQFAQKAGMNLVYRAQSSIAQPDFTSQCQAAQSAGAQAFLIALDPNGIQRVAQSCAAVNFHPIYATGNLAAPVSLASNPLLAGMVVGQVVLPWMVTSNPQIVEYQQVMRQYAPGQDLDAASIMGWVSAKLLQRVGGAIGDSATSQSILDGLWQVKNDDLGGVAMPLTFTKDQPAPQVFCYWSTIARGGKFTSDGQRKCK